MTQLTEQQLLTYSTCGLIPGPSESEADFLRRVDFCESEASSLLEKQFEMPIAIDSREVIGDAFPVTEGLFGIRPDWVPVTFSDKNLAPWHGGCAWIFQMNENSPMAALMQLRTHFKHNERYLGIYTRDELISHELAHVGRMMFEEPKYEELLAYRTATSRFRRWFGPILRSSREALFFVAVLMLIFGLDLMAILTKQIEMYQVLVWLKALPFLLIGAALIRLWRRQNTMRRCLDRLTEVLRSRRTANHLLYRLTDSEIDLFAGMKAEDIVQYINENDNSPRRRLLRAFLGCYVGLTRLSGNLNRMWAASKPRG